MRHVVIDTETTGLCPKKGHRLVEIGCVELSNYIPTKREFHCYLNPQRPMPKEAFAVHGLSEDFLRGHELFSQKVESFLEFVGGDSIVAHNASFDMGFLNFQLQELGFPPLKNPVVDTLALARKKFPGSPASLNALCKKFGVSTAERSLHGALLDARLLSVVFLEMEGGLQQGLSFKDRPLHEDLPQEANLGGLKNGSHRFPKETSLSKSVRSSQGLRKGAPCSVHEVGLSRETQKAHEILREALGLVLKGPDQRKK